MIALSHKRSEAENPPARASLKLRLYLSDHTFETVAAVAQVHSFLQKHGSTYALEILDVHENQDLVRQDEVPFTPMLLRLEPAKTNPSTLPVSEYRRLVPGDVNDGRFDTG